MACLSFTGSEASSPSMKRQRGVVFKDRIRLDSDDCSVAVLVTRMGSEVVLFSFGILESSSPRAQNGLNTLPHRSSG